MNSTDPTLRVLAREPCMLRVWRAWRGWSRTMTGSSRERSVAAPLRISRVAAPVPEFRSRHVATRQPVVIDGLFDGQPIRRLATARAARRAIGDMDFVVQWNYTANLYYANAREAGQPERTTLASYLDYVALNPRTPRMCIEQPIAPTLAALIEPPAMCWNNERTLMFIG